MIFRILGSGTCVPSLKRNAPSNYLNIEGKEFLIDCGSGTLLQLERAALSYKTIDFVCITHFHPDHISDLNPLIHALIWTPGFVRKKDLVIIGPVGIEGFCEKYILPVSGCPLPDSFCIIIKEMVEPIRLGNIIIEFVKTKHSPESIAYKFSENRKSIVVTGDADYDEELIKFSENCDLLIIESSYPDENKVKGHMTPKECTDIAVKAKVKKMILTHLYPVGSDQAKLLEAKNIFPNTILAEDLMTISI